MWGCQEAYVGECILSFQKFAVETAGMETEYRNGHQQTEQSSASLQQYVLSWPCFFPVLAPYPTLRPPALPPFSKCCFVTLKGVSSDTEGWLIPLEI